MNIEGSRILITGGARGIGRALVEGLLDDGALVGVFEKDALACKCLAEDYSSRVLTWECDVSDPVQVDRAVNSAWNSGFIPDILINNAGIIHSEPLVNISKKSDRIHSREAWRNVMAADLDSVFYVTSKVVDGMVQRRSKGVVISISSISANGNPGQSAYSAAKAGVNALTKTWAKELGALGIRFIAIAPGFLDTPSTINALNENSISRLQQQIPLRKLGTTTAIHLAARAIIENDYINGTVIEVDGGLSI
jgi:3-oxoacyl-[acyl-carrier protein] reductase